MCSVDTSNGKLDWNLTKETLLSVYPDLAHDYEIGGKFTFRYSNGIIHRKTSHRKIFKNKGGKDNVTVPNGILNYHTHPISCYIQEKTTWGWCSGEDIRETLIFGLKGTLAHAILAIEGCYLLQVSNCAIDHLINISTNESPSPKLIKHFCDALEKSSDDTSKYTKNLGMSLDQLLSRIHQGDPGVINQIFVDILRGIIMVLIEIYFRSCHRFRTYSFNKKKRITPYDFIKVLDTFKIRNIFSNKSISGCGNVIRCNGIPIGNNKVSNFKKYIREYEYDTGFYICDKVGNVISVDIPLGDIIDILPSIESIAHDLDNCKEWFHASLTENLVLVNGSYKPYVSLPTDSQFKILQYYNKNYQHYIDQNIYPLIPNSDAKFYWFNLKGDCSHKDIHNHRQTSRYKSSLPKGVHGFHIIGSPKCPYTIKADKLLTKYNIPFKREYYDEISKALSVSGTETIPAIYHNGTYIGGFTELSKYLN